MKNLLIFAVLLTGVLVGCNQNEVDKQVSETERISLSSEVEYSNDDADQPDEVEADEYSSDDQTGTARVAAIPRFDVWFQCRTEYDGTLTNNVTVKLYNLTTKVSNWNQLSTAQGTETRGGDYLYTANGGNFSASLLDVSKPTKTYITKKPTGYMYKRLKLRNGYYVAQITNGAYNSDQYKAFRVNSQTIRIGMATNGAIDERDGVKAEPGKFKVSIWNGPYKPSSAYVNLIPFDGSTNLAHYNTIAQSGMYADLAIHSIQATGTKKTCVFSQLPGEYIALFALNAGEMGEAGAMGMQKVTIQKGKIYPHVKLSFVQPPAN